ncbi:MAG: histidine kinase [Opitutaceae bacterium]|nr:histidine kinase [Opitutaceae bacterium]
MSAPSRASRWRGHRRYWRAQLLGWGVVGTVFFAQDLLAAKERVNHAGTAGFLVYFALCGIGASHMLRCWMQWRGAIVGRWQRLVGPGLTGVFGAGLFLAGAVFALPLAVPVARADLWTDKPAAAFGGMLGFCALLCLGWLLLYLGYQSVQAYQQALVERVRLDAALKDAELRALRGQLNPHFLFNALNVVRRLAATDPSRTRQAITQLASLLRDTLNGGDAPTVKVSAELRQVEAYLDLEKLRFEERLEVVVDCDPAALGRPVPPFSVLTLVENAVKHGIASKIAGGRLGIRIVAEPELTVVRITNPGPLDGAPRQGRVGLPNLRERMRLLYGERATLTIGCEDGATVVSELKIPNEWPLVHPLVVEPGPARIS